MSVNFKDNLLMAATTNALDFIKRMDGKSYTCRDPESGDDVELFSKESAYDIYLELRKNKIDIDKYLRKLEIKELHEVPLAGVLGIAAFIYGLSVNENPHRNPRNLCMHHIEEFLCETPVSVSELILEIEKGTGTRHGVSTVFANLQRGEKLGKFKKDGIRGLWSIVKQEN